MTANRVDFAPSARTPPGTRVYAVGDIHGRHDLLCEMHILLAQDAAAHRDKRRVLVYLGDYIDRGPNTFDVIDALIHDPPAGFETIYLKGNHEDFLLRFLDGGGGESWLFNGGGATLASYGIGDGDPFETISNLDSVRRRLADAVPSDHLNFFQNLKLFHAEGGYFLVHAGVRPGVSLDEQDPHDLMWIRDPFLFSDVDFGAVVVHGHTPTPAPDIWPNRIGIDTYACRSGQLTCLVLDGAERTFLQT